MTSLQSNALVRRAHGVTLVELLVVVVLMALLTAPLASMVSTAARSSTVQANQLDLQNQAEFAVRRMVQQVRQSGTAPVANSATRTTLDTATYDVVTGTTGGTSKLIETIGGKQSVLAEPVTAFSMVTLPPSGNLTQGLVGITVTLARADAQASVSEVTRLGGAR